MSKALEKSKNAMSVRSLKSSASAQSLTVSRLSAVHGSDLKPCGRGVRFICFKESRNTGVNSVFNDSTTNMSYGNLRKNKYG